MQLVKTILIKKTYDLYKEIDHLAFLSKNVYNSALYVLRQIYFAQQKEKKKQAKLNKKTTKNIKSNKKAAKTIRYKKSKKKTKSIYPSAFDIINQYTHDKNPDYNALPKKVSQQTIKVVRQNLSDYFAAKRAYKINPKKFNGAPRLPKYKDKVKGRAILIFDKQVISRKEIKQGIIKFYKTNIKIKTDLTYDQINQVQITKKINSYQIAIIYTVPDVPLKKKGITAAIDLGINNLATLTFSQDRSPQLINGHPLKSINQFYNKEKSKLQSALDKQFPNRKMSNKIAELTQKRNNKVKDYLHKASRYIVNQLVSKGVKQIVIGYNKNWKQEANIGKKNNQNFINIPHKRLADMVKYKCQLVGIKVIINEESYTSKCSFLDLEPIKKHKKYMGNDHIRFILGVAKTGGRGSWKEAGAELGYFLISISKNKN